EKHTQASQQRRKMRPNACWLTKCSSWLRSLTSFCGDLNFFRAFSCISGCSCLSLSFFGRHARLHHLESFIICIQCITEGECVWIGLFRCARQRRDHGLAVLHRQLLITSWCIIVSLTLTMLLATADREFIPTRALAQHGCRGRQGTQANATGLADESA